MGRFLKTQTSFFFKRMTTFSIITSIIYLIIGVCLILINIESVKMVGCIASIALLLVGSCTGFKYFKRDGGKIYRYNIIYFIVELIFALLLILVPYESDMFLKSIFGGFFIVYGTQKVVYGFWLKIGNDSSWLITTTIGIMLAIFGVLLLTDSFTALSLHMLIGIFMVLLSILELTSSLLVRKRAEEIVSIFW